MFNIDLFIRLVLFEFFANLPLDTLLDLLDLEDAHQLLFLLEFSSENLLLL
jgi:hypothetical protein